MVGRINESRDLLAAFESDQSEFVAVYGRRRVGKTYLINEVFNGKFAFHATGIESASRAEQLESFWNALRQQGMPRCRCPRTWIAAFAQLEELLQSLPVGKKVVFFDELPWFDSRKSGFLKAFEAFWNGWCSLRKDILLVVCGSATTWIIEKVLQARGGLHNRVTRQIPLAPFTLAECEEYANYKKLMFDRRQILECYMAFGGVAYYWSLLRSDLSAVQNIDRLFFGQSDEMRNEYNRIFTALFRTSTMHVAVVQALGTKKAGMTRDEILRKVGGTGGGVSDCLLELESCGFIRKFNPLGRVKKGSVYQLIDNYLLFYFAFLEKRSGNDELFWMHNCRAPILNSWRGLAFERVCFWHVRQLKAALGISGVAADVYSWYGKAEESDKRSVQIDMVIDRADNTVSMCEMKYAADEYELDAEESGKIARRADVLSAVCRHRKAIQAVLVTPYGLKQNKYSGNIQQTVTMDALFLPA